MLKLQIKAISNILLVILLLAVNRLEPSSLAVALIVIQSVKAVYHLIKFLTYEE